MADGLLLMHCFNRLTHRGNGGKRIHFKRKYQKKKKKKKKHQVWLCFKTPSIFFKNISLF